MNQTIQLIRTFNGIAYEAERVLESSGSYTTQTLYYKGIKRDVGVFKGHSDTPQMQLEADIALIQIIEQLRHG